MYFGYPQIYMYILPANIYRLQVIYNNLLIAKGEWARSVC